MPKLCPGCDKRLETYEPGVSYVKVDGVEWHPRCAPAPVHEIFLVQLDRAEIEFVMQHVATLYVVELAREQTPAAAVLQPATGEIESLVDFLTKLGAKAIAQAAAVFLKDRGVEGCRVLANKFLRLLGSKEL